MAEPGEEEKRDAAAAEGADPSASIDFSAKHPLENSWTMWFDIPTGRQKQSTWGQTLRSVYTFDTVEDFWCLYNNIVTPSRLVYGSDFSLFKQGIEPKWEDTANQMGGKWTFMVPKSTGKNVLDTLWLNTLLALIGEQFDDGDEVCGAVVNVRNKQDRISIWTRSSSNESVQLAVGKAFKSCLDLGESTKIGFLVHDDSIKLDKKAKDRYTV